MQSIINIFRSFIYMLLTFIFVGQAYKGLDIFCGWLLNGLGSIQHSLNVFLFWVLFALLGVVIFSLLWSVFKFAIVFIISLITNICPYPKLGEWFINLNVIISLVYYIYLVWWENYNTSSFFGVMIAIIATFMGITLGRIITESTTSIFTKRRFKDFTHENMHEKIIEEIRNENKTL
jgi:hypothetical protein